MLVKAIISFPGIAQQCSNIELALPGIIENAVFDAILAIAHSKVRGLDQSLFIRTNHRYLQILRVRVHRRASAATPVQSKAGEPATMASKSSG